MLDKLLNRYSNFLAWFGILGMGILYSFMSVNNLRLFEIMGWDLGVFDHGIWQWSRFIFPYSTFHELYWLADHFHLILLTLVPFYWIWPNVRVLLISQGILVALGAYPLYLLSKRVTKQNLFGLVVVAGYLLYYSLQRHIFAGFHELSFLPLTLGFVMYFWETKKTKPYWLFFALSLLVKEEVGFLLAAFGLWGLLTDRTRWKQAALSIVLGLITTLGLIFVVMPQIGGSSYLHAGFGVIGDTPEKILATLASNPFVLVRAFVDSPIKIKTMFTNFWPWGFLPLFSPSTLILAIQQYALRFLDYGKVIRWTPDFAYSLPLATITAWGSIYGFRNLIVIFRKKFGKNTKLLGITVSLIVLALILAQQVRLHSPINSIFKRAFYRTEKWMEDNNKVLKCVPPNVSVSAQNSLGAWLSERKKIKVFPEGLLQGYDYLVVDLHSGQSEDSFYFFGSKNTNFVIDDLIKRNLYKVVCQEGRAMVLKRVADTTGKLNYPFELDVYER